MPPSREDVNSGLDVDGARRLFEVVYATSAPGLGKATSAAERKERGLKAAALTYGEVDFDAMTEIFALLDDREQGGAFVDIGSGVGNAAFAAALLSDFDLVVGFEILDELHGLCEGNLARWTELVRPQLMNPKKDTVIKFVRGDAAAVEWPADTSVVFANSTAFDTALMANIAKRAMLLRPGAIVVTTTRPLDGDFEVIATTHIRQSWGGDSEVFIQRRRGEEAAPDAAPSKEGE